MNTHWRRSPASFCFALSAPGSGGGSASMSSRRQSNSTNSVQLGNYYCEQRQVPPRICSAPVGRRQYLVADIRPRLGHPQPLIAMLAARQLTNQIDYVCYAWTSVSRDRHQWGNSTTTPLFYGFIPTPLCLRVYPPPAPCPMLLQLLRGTSMSSAPRPGTSKTNFLTVMLTSSNLAEAKLVIDRGVASDSTFPRKRCTSARATTRPATSVTCSSITPYSIPAPRKYSMQRTNVNVSNYLGYMRVTRMLLNIVPATTTRRRVG